MGQSRWNNGYNTYNKGNNRGNNKGNNRGNSGKNDRDDGTPIEFLNPYTFIPFSAKPAKPASWEETYGTPDKLLTGWLNIEIETKTPLIIPKMIGKNPEGKGKDREHKNYSFMKLPGNEEVPFIPGSSIRGMLRSVYETLTDSCVAHILDDKPISQRNPLYAGLKERGLLYYDAENKEWILYDADVYRKSCSKSDVSTGKYCGFCTGDKVFFTYDACKQIEEIRKEKGSRGYEEGWIQFNIQVPSKKRNLYSVRILRPTEPLYRWKDGDETPDKKLLSALSRDGVEGKVDTPKTVSDLKAKLTSAKNGAGNYVPVYYLLFRTAQGNQLFMSGSSIGRVGRNKKWKDIMGDFAPCTDLRSLCPACLLFGTTADGGAKGHVRFTDALPVEGKTLELAPPRTLQILGKPRPSAFEFYLNKPEPDAKYWNFDYYSKQVDDRNGKKRPEFHVSRKFMPRGRKYYWHYGDNSVAKDAAEKTIMNATAEAVSKGSFSFRMYFDAVTPQQLADMIWVITLGENTLDSRLLHKLGHAKPLGYGSVKLCVTDGVIRNVKTAEDGRLIMDLVPVKMGNTIAAGAKLRLDAKERAYILEAPGQEDPRRKNKIDYILKVSDAEQTKGLTIRYPVSVTKKGEEAIFEWFSKNRDVKKEHPAPTTLPDPMDECLTLTGRISALPQKQQKGGNAAFQNRKGAVGTEIVNATVLRINAEGNCRVKLENKKEEGLFKVQDKEYKINSMIQVRIIGYNEKYNFYKVEPV